MSLKITKLDTTEPLEKNTKSEGKGRRKTMRTFPRGILKVEGVKDPAKPPPLKKTAKRQTIQIITDVGAKKHRKTIRKKLSKMSNEKVKQIADKHGLLKGKGTPPSLVRDIVEGGAIAGFISLD
jgi:hypothetical protein